MSLADLVTGYADAVTEAVEDATGQEVDRALRYHGGPLPDSCCTDHGIVSAWVATVSKTVEFPIPLAFKGTMDGAFPLVELGAKWTTCWKVPAPDANNQITLSDEEYAAYDAAAARLERVAETVVVALMQLSCANPRDLAGVLGNVGCGLFRYEDCKPNDMARSGGCAGWTWRALAGLNSQQVS